ncbi:hypothetical protein MVLG_00898 [Microbotryum lychnidis-dioicae p1A1 Lamole]|uniref:Uncharacterized protein n=2 Tax=Microbotryum TaxID=34416 RepID=U5H0G5_USTV1|nr:hypothetical protein MVLG_00898 [Microbotryum lychnidis-dioicae p1A1 Lamole]SGY22833.1 BQ5605_C019g08863 [Microbotryum silenes-dioicae]|eukprot:KDE08792.1 hypothetical protein MVLG_00898 [Microbotryum lychnidis-dioicae p1A1 Lamole]
MNSSAAPSISVSSAPASIEAMHVQPSEQAQVPQNANQVEPGHGKMTLGAKGFLMKKMVAGGSFCSPTDTMVSPCTKKLAESKKRHYAKGKPLSLSSSFQSAQTGSQLVPGPKPSGLHQSSTPHYGSENAPMGL